MKSSSPKWNKIEDLYKNELEYLKNGYQDLKTVSNAKDDIVQHFMEIMKEQENSISEFKLKTKRSFDGKLDLADFKTFGFRIINEPKIVFVNKNEQPLIKIENTELRLKQMHMDNELESLKDLYKELTDKWHDWLVQIADLKFQNEALVKSYESKIK